MPYVRERDYAQPATAGELAYKISELIADYSRSSPRNYDLYAEVVGVLETVKLEYYRSRVGPYEEKKKVENGDVEW